MGVLRSAAGAVVSDPLGRRRPGRRWAGWTLVGLLGLGCATLQQLAALRQVHFSLGAVSQGRLAGVDLSRIRSYRDLTLTDVAAIGLALSRKQLPFELTVNVRAENPADNRVTARMTRLRWSLYLEDRETISGAVDDPVTLPPGEPGVIPVAVRLDLLEFFGGSAEDLVNLALAALGQDAPATTISLRAVPTVETPLGPIEYPSPITIGHETVGGAR